jgi:hypothetical protein
MDKLIHDFIDIKNYLVSRIDDKLDFFLTDIWDPMCLYALIREFNKTINSELRNQFPDFPFEYLPKTRFKVMNEDLMIEKHIQSFFNTDKNLTFLANLDIGEENYDLYYRKSYDPTTPFVFFAKYGHDKGCLMKGGKTAAAEYFMGKCTPLSVAFQIAQDEGFI